MKKVKKLLLSVFALSALMLSACSGSQEASSSQAPASSSQPAQTTSQAGESSSEAASSEEASSSEAASSEEASSSEAQDVVINVTVNDAPAASHKVWGHAWNTAGAADWFEATVSGTSISFNLGHADTYEGYLIVELKDGETAHPTKATSETPSNWDEVVLRQTVNVTDFTQTSVNWKVITTNDYTLTLDTTATTAYSGRTFFIHSWNNTGDTYTSFFTATGTAKILNGATGFKAGVMISGKTATDDLGTNWANVEKDATSDEVKTMPTTSVEIYASGSVLTVGVDGGEAPEVKGDFFIGIAPAGVWDSFKFVNLHVNPGDDTEYMATNVALGVGDIFYFETKFGGTKAWLHYAAMKNDSTAKAAFEDAGDTDHNFKVKTAGSYNFYVKSGVVFIEATPAS